MASPPAPSNAEGLARPDAAPAAFPVDGRDSADRLNRECFCDGADRERLRLALAEKVGDAALADEILHERPHLVSGARAFVGALDFEAMAAFVRASDAAARLPAFQEQALSRAPRAASIDHGPAGVFMGYDFHLTPEGPRLIEINTNAGGAFINAELAFGRSGCNPGAAQGRDDVAADFKRAALAMFETEFRRQFGARPLRRIAIVDAALREQYLYPEFLLARRMFEDAGYAAEIVDARSLAYDGAVLRTAAGPIDLVYNRLTDFHLLDPGCAALAAAWRDGAAAVTPSPRHHALYADKRNLVLLSDREAMRAMGLSAPDVDALALAPPARLVADGNADALWSDRRDLFFKPVAGYASRAVYRGDKMTKAVWSEIKKGGYIAQDYAPPSERRVRLDGAEAVRKMDIRLYAYQGEILLAAARLYQGQTTNFRTPGGGFAPVIVL